MKDNEAENLIYNAETGDHNERMHAGHPCRRRNGDRVRRGESLCTLHVGEHSDRIGAYNLLKRALVIGKEPVQKPPLVHAVVEV